MVYKIPIDELAQVEITSLERTALARLSQSKDFNVLVDILGRYLVSLAFDIIRTPTDTQNIDLIRRQGGLALLRKMVEYVETSEPTPTPRQRKNK